ncbi:ubiquitin carboxyl-terminal hydrolase family protein, partial [Trifolium medium]|nr:ubiquitin carboxyl-terminal hydrolase family protein [Trifolium medium]
EIEFEPNVLCEPVDENLTFNENELENGDIICFQKASEMVNEKYLRYPDVPSYLEYVHSQVHFSSSDTESKDEESVSESSEEEIKNIIDSEEIEAMIAEDAIGIEGYRL